MKLKLLDTFAWVGGFHLALEQSVGKENIECIGYSEIDKFAKQVYENNFPWTKDLGSITEIDIDNLEDFDLLTGWFPCQDVSVAWKQNLDWWRTILVEYLLQILEKKQPKYFIFENVKWLMWKKFKEFRESIFDRIQKAWYYFSYEILNTKNFWLPQNRERVFIVWFRMDWCPYAWFDFPKWQELTTFLKDVLEEEVDEKYYLSEKAWKSLQKYESNARICWDICSTLNTMQWWHRQPKIKVEIKATFWHTVYNIDWISPTTMDNHWDWVRIKEKNIRVNEFSKFNQDNIFCWKDYIVPTLTAWDGWNRPKTYIRKLTPTECCRLQWFPDDWNSNVSNSQRYKQMWNAISIPVVKAIFNKIFN